MYNYYIAIIQYITIQLLYNYYIGSITGINK